MGINWMGTNWSSYAYDSLTATHICKTRKPRICVHCKELIHTGELYSKWCGYQDMPEHYPKCPVKIKQGV